MIDADLLAEDHVAAEVGGDTGDGVAEHGKRDAVLTGSPALAHDQRRRIQRGRCEIEDSVQNSDLPAGIIGLRPVGDAGDCRSDRADEPDSDRQISGRAACLFPAEPFHRVKGESDGPRPDRNVRHHRMQRMAEPGAVQKIL